MNEALNLPLFFTALNKHSIYMGHTVRVVLMLILASEIPLIQAESLYHDLNPSLFIKNSTICLHFKGFSAQVASTNY